VPAVGEKGDNQPNNSKNQAAGVTPPRSTLLPVGTSPTSSSPNHGYWLVGSDGGIFTFGSAQFYGSTGSIQLNRPVVGITPTADHGGYWLVASDGGVFSFGDTAFYGSITGRRIQSCGSGLPDSLNASIVGIVPTGRFHGYFMVGPTAGSSPSVTPSSRARAPASVAVRAPPWPSCPMPAATGTGS
jgi:hypothetical protein